MNDDKDDTRENQFNINANHSAVKSALDEPSCKPYLAVPRSREVEFVNGDFLLHGDAETPRGPLTNQTYAHGRNTCADETKSSEVINKYVSSYCFFIL